MSCEGFLLENGLFYELFANPMRLQENPDWHYLTDSSTQQRKETNIIAVVDNVWVGACGIQVNPYDTNALWFMFVSVVPGHQNKGLAKLLVKEAVEYCGSLNKTIYFSSYSKDGLVKIKPYVNILKQKYPGMILDQEH